MEGSGPIHVVSRASQKFKDDVTNKVYKECKHSKDQAVVCKGGLGPTSPSGIANIVHDIMRLAKKQNPTSRLNGCNSVIDLQLEPYSYLEI